MTDRDDGPPPVHILKGSDVVVLADALRDLVDDLVGDADRAMTVEELRAGDYLDDREDKDISSIVYAAQTPPFLTDRRVVVAREAALFTKADEVAPLVGYLADPLPTTSLILVWEKAPRQQKLGAVPKSLKAAVQAAGGTIVDTAPPAQARQRGEWLGDQLSASSVKLAADARRLIADSLGEDVSRVGALLEMLTGTYGAGAKISADEVEPFLGQKGGVAPWDLTDAIDTGDIALAIDHLHRLLGGGDRNAIGLMYTLHGHYQRMLALDGADISSDKEAAALLGIAPFPAKKARQQGGRLGSDGVAAAIRLLSVADLELRGQKAWPPELVLEVLVARLAQSARRSR